MTVVYLAAKFEDRASMLEIRRMLEEDPAIGVCARWIGEPLDREYGSAEPLRHKAARDLGDVEVADVVVVFAEPLSKVRDTTGGRHVETGYAIALGKPIIFVGRPGHIFTTLRRMTRIAPPGKDIPRFARRLRRAIHRVAGRNGR